ncbi:MAG: DUF1338 domain-containing protein [Bdellovibrionota bacterium]
MEQISDLLQKMWLDYVLMNPEAERIHQLLAEKETGIVNDHIALRTFSHPKVGIDRLVEFFTPYGYTEKGTYHFEEKKLFAKHLEAEGKPKIFISELLLDQFSNTLQEVANSCIESISEENMQSPSFLYSGTHWKKSFKIYEELKAESEYASWLYAIGFRPNHFTISVNDLKSFKSLNDLNHFLKENNFKLNNAGGEIKGTPEVLLEQSSTLASLIEVEFDDGKKSIPGCYYEFALRYPMENNQLYQGFIAKSADKIFESTDRGY